MRKTLIIITGPIGVGKSTFAELIMRDISFPKVEYISADLYFGVYFRGKSKNQGIDYANAKKYCSYKLNKAVSLGKSFIWETVVAKKDKIDFIKKCRSSGYRIISLFITIENYDLLISRVTNRYKQGWYDIPQNKIMNRFYMIEENKKALIKLSDEFIVIDATCNFRQLYSIRGNQLNK